MLNIIALFIASIAIILSITFLKLDKIERKICDFNCNKCKEKEFCGIRRRED